MQMAWLNRLRLRALALVLGITLAAIGAVSLAALPAWPVVGVAVAAVAVVINGMTHRLAAATCLGCGHDVSGVEPGVYGVTCPHCGSVSHVTRFGGASNADDRDTTA